MNFYLFLGVCIEVHRSLRHVVNDKLSRNASIVLYSEWPGEHEEPCSRRNECSRMMMEAVAGVCYEDVKGNDEMATWTQGFLRSIGVEGNCAVCIWCHRCLGRENCLCGNHLLAFINIYFRKTNLF